VTALEPEPPDLTPELEPEQPDEERRPQLEPAPPVPPATAPPPIGITDRCASIGMTGKGKSVWCRAVFVVHLGQRLLIDVNDAYEPGPDLLSEESGGYCRAERHRDIDWRCRTVHFIPRRQSMELYNDLYAAVFDRGNICVWLDECFGPTTANRYPDYLRTVLQQGRKRNIRHLAAFQEPMNVLPVLYTQAEHVALFKIAQRPDELNRLAYRFLMSPAQLAGELDRLEEHGYLRSTIGSPQVFRMPPLPLELVERGERTFYAPKFS
jgi:hypothetical protein